MKHHQTIFIADFGSQFTKLISRAVRRCNVYCQIVPHQKLLETIATQECRAVILSGSPDSVNDDSQNHIITTLIEKKIPILGICYGFQLIVKALKGKVALTQKREFGEAHIEILHPSILYDNIWQVGGAYPTWMSHSDHVIDLPEGFICLARTQSIDNCIVSHPDKHIYGLQFHPEVTHTPQGITLIDNFLKKIANCKGDWNMKSYKSEGIEKISQQIGDGYAICAISGGVDSTVAAVMTHEAIGDRLHCLLIDTGLMRHNECSQVLSLYRQKLNISIECIDAKEHFFNALKDVTDPEQKRKIIGRCFIEIFENYALNCSTHKASYLVQGTLYPDVIESMALGGKKNVTIKSHHNVGGLPERLKMSLVEPLRELFKDEVRNLGQELDIPQEFLKRHPFPGPGLGIRIPGAITQEKCNILRAADAIFIDEIKKNALYDEIWQAFVVLLPVKSVGVMGDGRSYEYACTLRAVNSHDGMTAEVYPFSATFLKHTATRIINEVKGINRVLYDYTTKPPGTIEWE